MTEPTDETLRSWLLGQIPLQEAEALEQRLLEDEDFGQRLRAVENDLLDDFARERLHGEERARAAAYFAATPADRARLRIARALAVVAGAATASRDRHPQRGTAPGPAHRMHGARGRRVLAAGLFASACAIAIAVVGIRLRTPEEAAVPAVTITLMDNQQRGAQTARLLVPRTAANLRLQAEVGAAPPDARYTLRIEDADVAVFTAKDLVPRVTGPYRFVEVTLPSAVLATGVHRVRVASQGAPETVSSWMLTTRAE
jgi:hypothetical protein